MSDVWKVVLEEIEQTISRENFAAWFTGAELKSADNGVVVVETTNVFRQAQLKAKYTDVLTGALRGHGIDVKKLEIVVGSGARTRIDPDAEMRRGSANVERGGRMIKLGATSGNSRFSDNMAALKTGLNSCYTMDNFVIGTNNDLAVSVARNIIDNPGTSYNPFFLYGGPGLGKTHLVQAIGNEILAKFPDKKVLYTPVSTFYADFIKALNKKSTDEFRQRFRKLDVLIVDDFQMIMKKDASQVEFFDIFNELYQLNKQIIVTSDRLPSQIESVDERLASRLTWAGAFDLQLPQFEDRCAILRAKAEYRGVEIEDEAIEYIAENVQTNIRTLEGELQHILAVADFKGMTPLQVINEGYINTPSQAKAHAATPKMVIEKVAKYYELTPKELCSRSRVANIKNARQVAMYIMSKDLNMSTTKIASEVGLKDHTTAMHGIKMVESRMKLDFNLRDQVASIKGAIYG